MTTKWTNKLRTRLPGTAVPARDRLAGLSPWGCEKPNEVADDEDRSWRTLQVTVVADEPDADDGLAALVRKWGHDAHAIRSCHTASATGRPDVVLLNIEWMPFGEWQAVRRMRSELARSDCLIVALIRHAHREHRRQCRKAGIDLVFVKPVESAVMETLLLLECTRINRLHAEVEHSP